MNIRRAQRSDLSTIAAIHAESWADAYAGVLPQKYLADQMSEDLQHHWSQVKIKPRDVVLVAEKEGVIGFIAVWCRQDPFIDNLHVKPTSRSRGIGTALMRSAAQKLIRQGHKVVWPDISVLLTTDESAKSPTFVCGPKKIQ